MKATGIVRRIDDLGRIVIPKEIRKTLKVKEGMPLEIYTDKEGGIILRKFLPFSEMSSLSEEFAQCVAQQMGNAVFVTDREKVVAAAGYTGEDGRQTPLRQKRNTDPGQAITKTRMRFSMQYGRQQLYIQYAITAMEEEVHHPHKQKHTET